MNWTDGSLARHARGRGWNSELAKQQEYFAKARSGLREASRQPPGASISFLPSHHAFSLGNYRKTSSGHRVRELSAIPSPHFQSHSGRHKSQEVLRSESYSARHSPDQDTRAGCATAQPHTSVKPGREGKRKADSCSTLEAKRKRLLQKVDWAGLQIQKPIPLRFPTHKSPDNHQIWGFGDKSVPGNYSPFFAGHAHMAANPHQRLTRRVDSQNGSPSVHIRIGSQHVRREASSQNPEGSSCKGPNQNKRTLKSLRQPAPTRSQGSEELSHLSQHLWEHFKHARPPEATVHGSPRGRHDDSSQAPYQLGTQKRPKIGLRNAREQSKIRREDQPLHIASSPFVVHQPVPQRLSQLLLRDQDTESGSDTCDTTSGQVGRRPASAVLPSEVTESERWHNMPTFTESHETHHAANPSLDTLFGPKASQIPVIGNDDLANSRSCIGDDPVVAHSPTTTSAEADNPVMRRGIMTETEHAKHVVSEHIDGTCEAEPCSVSSTSHVTRSPLFQHAYIPSSSSFSDSIVQEEYNSIEEASNQGDYSDDELFRAERDISASETDRKHQYDHAFEIASAKAIPDCGAFASTTFIHPASKAGQGRRSPTPKAGQDDAGKDWMNFIFGGNIDEAHDRMLLEAVHNTARDLRPSSSISDQHNHSQETLSQNQPTEAAATCGSTSPMTGYPQRLGISPDPDFDRKIGTESDANPFPPSFSPDSDLGLPGCHIKKQHVRRNKSSHVHQNVFAVPQDSDSASTSSIKPIESASQAVGHLFTPVEDNVSMIAQTSESEKSNKRATTYTFTQPKNFVGRMYSVLGGTMAPNRSNKMPKKRGRSRKKTNDGRADIRALPNCEDDPIDGSDD